MTNHALTALRTWLSLWWIVMGVACSTARPPGATATPSPTPSVRSDRETGPEAEQDRLDADAVAVGRADEIPTPLPQARHESAPEPALTDSGLRLFWNRRDADRTADRFSLDLPTDLWGALDPHPVTDQERTGRHLELVMVWSPSPPPTPDLFPYHLGPRSWRELSTWEQIGVVVQTASAIAGVIYLLDRFLR